MKIRIVTLLATIYLSSWTNLAAQSVETRLTAVLPPSPNAASLAKFVEIPVSTFNGVPNISIPLYEIKEGDITVPVVLSYHSSGIKVGEDASSVGLGWSLSSGGEVVVDIKGKTDYRSDESFVNYRNATFPFPVGSMPFESAQPQIFTSGDCSYQNELNQFLKYCGEYPKPHFVDTEPDMYLFNFINYSGKFFFRRTFINGFRVFNSEVIDRQKIIFNIGGTFYNTLHAVTPDGSQYFFDESEKSRLTRLPNLNSNEDWLQDYRDEQNTSSYKLTKIISPTKREVTFEYLPGPAEVILTPNISFSKSLPAPATDAGTISHGKVVTKDLDIIRFSNGYIKFYRSLRQDILNGVKIDSICIFRTPENVRLKTIIFNYDYFVGAANFGDFYTPEASFSGVKFSEYTEDFRKKRLKLNSIQIKNGSVKENPYVFNYHTQQLPFKTSLAVDFYGYFNGAALNKTLLPNGTELSYYYKVPKEFEFHMGGSRSPNEITMQAGILTAITYPTGGTTNFYYEANRFTNLNTIQVRKRIYATDMNNMDSFTPDVPVSEEFTFNASKQISIDISLSGTVDHNNDGEPDGLCHAYLNDGGLHVEIQQKVTGGWVTPVDYSWLLCEDADIINARLDIFNFTKTLPAGTYRLLANTPNDLISHTMGDARASITINFYINQTVGEVIGGGLRVSKIVDNPIDGPSITRVYSYTNGKNLSMPVFTREFDFDGSTSDCVTHINGIDPCFPAGSGVPRTPGSSLYSSTLVSYSNSANGSYVGYPKVSVEYEGKEKGKTEYVFQINSEHFNFPTNTLPGVPTPNSLDNGFLKSLTDFRYDLGTNSYVPVRKVSNEPEIQDKLLTWAYKSVYIPPLGYTYGGGGFSCWYCGGILLNLYPIKLGRVAITSTKEEIFDPITGSNKSTTKQFTYNAAGFTKSTTVTGSDGRQSTIETTYPSDYTGVTSGWLSEMKTKNMIEYPIESVERVAGSAVKGSYTEFSFHDGMVTPFVSYSLNTTTPLPGFSLSVPNNVKHNAYAVQATYTYNVNGNITEFQKTNDLMTSLSWNFNNTLPEANVTNAMAKDIFHTSFEDATGTVDLNVKTGLKMFTANYTRALTKLSNGNYELVYWKRTAGIWAQVKATIVVSNSTNGSNGTYSINISGVTATVPIDEVRFYPVGAQMTTYAYDPLVGPISTMDPNGTTVFYEYDKLGRLKLSKDNDKKILVHQEYHYIGQN